MITQGMPKKPIKQGGSMTPGIRIEIKHIAELNIKIKQGKGTNVVLAIETFLPPGDIARIYNLSKQGVPVSTATIRARSSRRPPWS